MGCYHRPKILRPTLLLPPFFLTIMLLGSCDREQQMSDLRAPEEPSTLLSRDELNGVSAMTLKVLREFPSDEYIYVFVGRSPTPLYAALDAKPGIRAMNIPLTDIPSVMEKVSYRLFVEEGDDTDYLQKLFAHFDTYLNPTLDDLAVKAIPQQKFLVVDFILTGHSLAQFKRLFDFYLRFKAKSQSHLSNLLDVKTEYLGLYSNKLVSDQESLRTLQSTIQSYRTPFTSPVQGGVRLRQVQVGQANGSVPKFVDIDRKIAMMNTRTASHEWHWTGKVYAIEDIGGDALYDKFVNQWFDQYAAVGPWYIEESILVNTVQKRSESQELFEIFQIDCAASE